MIRVILRVSVCAPQPFPAPRANSSPLDLDSRLAAQILEKHQLGGSSSCWLNGWRTIDNRLMKDWWIILCDKENTIWQYLTTNWYRLSATGNIWRFLKMVVPSNHPVSIPSVQSPPQGMGLLCPAWVPMVGLTKKGRLPTWHVPFDNQTQAAMGNPIF
jgi:hypothetical protein